VKPQVEILENATVVAFMNINSLAPGHLHLHAVLFWIEMTLK
jgi:diadenosine tetraphosphate (Ap4A) HIT family hydrolase